MLRRPQSGWLEVSLLVSGVVWGAGCREKPQLPEPVPPVVAAKTSETHITGPGTAQSASAQKTTQIADGVPAVIGKPAPNFELSDLNGKSANLTDLQGKVVVLEWFNPNCPFVRAAHNKGSLVDTAKRLQKLGVIYLAVNSAAPGKQGYGAEVNRTAADEFKLDHPILLDETGAVGKAYGATNTPHLFVIDDAGILVYRGAIDNSPDGEGDSPEGGKLVSYLEEAVAAVLADQPVKVPETKAYGCAVKYGT